MLRALPRKYCSSQAFEHLAVLERRNNHHKSRVQVLLPCLPRHV
jgi:hypothetical protein